MIRVGMVDLSTSHPRIFAPLLAGLGWPVTAVLDPVEARARAFAGEYPRVVVAGSLDELAGLCDVVMLLGADWDERMGQLKALAAHEIPVFVDKPMAGTAGELGELAGLADGRIRVDGGSALRVAPEAVRVRGSGLRPAVVDVSCSGHPFYYGVHAVALATAVLGPGLLAAQGESNDLDQSVTGVIRHASGAEIRVAVSASGPAGGFRVAVDSGREIEPAAEAFYPALLQDTITRLTTPETKPRPGRELVECELALLAMARSVSLSGNLVALDEVPGGFRPWPGRGPRR
jgi:hypothetical protein